MNFKNNNTQKSILLRRIIYMFIMDNYFWTWFEFEQNVAPNFHRLVDNSNARPVDCCRSLALEVPVKSCRR